MSPCNAQATGEREGWRQRRQEPKGRKESRERRVACEPQVDLSWERSWEVKNASEVLRLLWDIFGKRASAKTWSDFENLISSGYGGRA